MQKLEEAHGGTKTIQDIIEQDAGRQALDMKRILIVEDDEKIAMLERDYLESSGYETVILGEGGKVIAELKKNHYDLVLLDIMLPGCSGYEICRQIRNEIDIPILMVTAGRKVWM